MFRKGWLAIAVVAMVLAVPGTAFAHVEITAANPPGADDVVLASLFAENECTDALKTVQLFFPAAPELTVAAPEVTGGWTSAVEKQPDSAAVASVTWTNTDGVAGDGEFRIALGRITADQEPINFKAIQVCADGKIFRWIEAGENSEFPALVLALDHAGHSDGHSHSHGVEPTATKATVDKKSDDSSSTGIIIGVAAAVIALGIGAFVIARRKKPSDSNPAS